MRHALIAAALLSLAGPALADSVTDATLRKEALLRGYTTSEAERRFEEYQRNPQAHVDALNKGIGNLVSNMYQRQAAKQAATKKLWDEMWEAIKYGKDYPVYSAGEGAELRKMLEVQLTRDDGGEVMATRRLVEYALHIRPFAEFIFPEPDYAYAVSKLHAQAYGNPFDAWSSNTLARLYLLGLGVPKDESEALSLVTRCGDALGIPSRAKSRLDDARCAMTKVRILEEGWGVPKDPKKAASYLDMSMERFSTRENPVQPFTREKFESMIGR